MGQPLTFQMGQANTASYNQIQWSASCMIEEICISQSPQNFVVKESGLQQLHYVAEFKICIKFLGDVKL